MKLGQRREINLETPNSKMDLAEEIKEGKITQFHPLGYGQV